MRSRSFDNKVVLITGCAGGIGSAHCHEFLSKGATVLGIDILAPALETLQQKLASPLRKKFFAEICDISDEKQVKQSIQSLLENHGAIDVLVNNMGCTETQCLHDSNSKNWLHEIHLNLNSTYFVTQAVLPSMLSRKQGNIIMIGSVNASMMLGSPAYSAAKAGLLSYVKSIAVEYGACGIRANMLSPGSVLTKAWSKRLKKNPNIIEELKAWYPLQKVVTPEAVAKAAAFLASSDAQYITGINLPVDAGLSAGTPPLVAAITNVSFSKSTQKIIQA